MKAIILVAAAALTLQAGAWRGSATAGVQLSERGGTLTVANSGRVSVDVWREGSAPLSGSYTIRATLRKVSGRNHESYGILFGGRNLGAANARYSYVMIRGDGGVLVKKRDGSANPVVRNWQTVPAVHPDDAQAHAENVVEVRVTPREVIALVNGTEVVRVPAADLYTDGMAGLRFSHQMEVAVAGFTAGR